jgi:hypothetical protein
MGSFKVEMPIKNLDTIVNLDYVVSCQRHIPRIVMSEHDDTDVLIWNLEINPDVRPTVVEWLRQRGVTMDRSKFTAPLHLVRELQQVPGVWGIEEIVRATL